MPEIHALIPVAWEVTWTDERGTHTALRWHEPSKPHEMGEALYRRSDVTSAIERALGIRRDRS